MFYCFQPLFQSACSNLFVDFQIIDLIHLHIILYINILDIHYFLSRREQKRGDANCPPLFH